MGTRLGRYDVIDTLAKGSLTDLLLGRATGEAGFQRYVAIKLLRAEHAEDPACLEMFVNEARLAAALHHHNIVQVLDIGDENGQPFFAMEYVHGVDLRTLLNHLARRNEQLPLQHVVSIIAAVAAALHHAHEQRGPDGRPLGIVHRQVTPSNILVGFDGNVKIVDFSIAKAAIKRMQTGVGVLKGSAPYMAPEQCAGRGIDRRSDVFALGIVLYELATVRRLFKGANEFLTMSAVVNAEVPRPSQYRRDVPGELEVVMLKSLARDPLARYQTANDMANALDQVARTVGVGASTTALANYLKLQFGERREPWLEPARVLADPDMAVDFDGGASGLAPPANESVQSNAIPRIVSATKSSPIAHARSSAMTSPRARRPSAASVPIDRSFAVATTVDDLEPASSRASTDPGELELEDEPITDALAMPVTAGPPVRPTPPPRPSAPVIETTRASQRELNITDATAVVEPLAVVVARAQTSTGQPPRKALYVVGGAVLLVAIAAVIALWPTPDLAPASSAAPAPAAPLDAGADAEPATDLAEAVDAGVDAAPAAIATEPPAPPAQKVAKPAKPTKRTATQKATKRTKKKKTTKRRRPASR